MHRMGGRHRVRVEIALWHPDFLVWEEDGLRSMGVPQHFVRWADVLRIGQYTSIPLANLEFPYAVIQLEGGEDVWIPIDDDQACDSVFQGLRRHLLRGAEWPRVRSRLRVDSLNLVYWPEFEAGRPLYVEVPSRFLGLPYGSRLCHNLPRTP